MFFSLRPRGHGRLSCGATSPFEHMQYSKFNRPSKAQHHSQERKAVKDGFLFLPLTRRAKLAFAISDGNFWHKKLCLVLIGKLNVIPNSLADCFEEYVHTNKRLFGAKPAEDNVRETTCI